MKALTLILSLALPLATPVRNLAFTNLDFESAVIQSHDPNFGWLDWSLAAPGWSHSAGDSTDVIYYGLTHLGTTQIYLLLDTNTQPYGTLAPLAGEYSLAFASGFATGPGDSEWINAFISQTGEIPVGAESLHLLATGPFSVFVGGVSIPMVSLGGDSFAGDIHSFAGTTAAITIMNTAPWGSVHTHTVVDNLAFSPIPIPEPSCLALVAVALAAARSFRRGLLRHSQLRYS
jgi:hypothetical protein